MGKYDEAVFIPVKCRETKKMFYARYDFAADDRWVLTYGIPEDKMSDSCNEKSGKIGKVDVANGRTGPQYCCPYCGNIHFVKCGICGKLVCWGNESWFRCVYCGHSGEIQGVIQEQDGEGGTAQ